MINTVLVDDEPKSRLVLRNLLEFIRPDIVVRAEASDISDGVQTILAYQPQLVFLDIHLLNGDSFQILEQIPEPLFEVIFVTAYDEYSVKALRFCRIPCLFKPIDLSELECALTDLNFTGKPHIKYEMLLKLLRSGFTEIPFIDHSEVVMCKFNEVYFLRELEHGVDVFTDRGRFTSEGLVLDDFRNTFELNTFRSLGSEYLINSAMVSAENSKNGVLVFQNGDRIVVDKELLYQFVKTI
ncbi:MAG: response regulator [Flavobacteriales bacterium]|nr:response regulator [Flavobacteriales bacterium]